jgi:hypothetical protein
MKKLLVALLMAGPLSISAQNVKIRVVNNIVFVDKLVENKGFYTISVEKVCIPSDSLEFRNMFETLYNGIRCPTRMQEIQFALGISKITCDKKESLSNLFACLILRSNNFIKNAYKF